MTNLLTSSFYHVKMGHRLSHSCCSVLIVSNCNFAKAFEMDHCIDCMRTYNNNNDNVLMLLISYSYVSACNECQSLKSKNLAGAGFV